MASALVLGAAGGVGRAVVARLAAGGSHVVAVDLDPMVCQLPGVHAALAGDATEPAVIGRAFDVAPEPPSVLVHALLHELRAPLGELTPAQWHKVFDVGLVSAWQAAAELVRRKGAGPASVVLVGSVHAHGAAPDCAPYAVAKAGLGALARAAATEWGPLGVRTNVVEPGFVPVERNAHRWRDPAARARVEADYPLGRLCSPEEIADVVAFLAGPSSSYVNGVCLPVDGGYLAALPEVTKADAAGPRS
ncbi:SDR family NAD(P)-dependent oxidoreductase [Streptomyces endophyticus]|uniref:SDR family oxidoreductase n=1 Tax=Streptomyces endophyticus TaxID=714166 RepID=A0ABU6FGQ0_9ACTN|nr:SDR family oxidoreductase [Streptomyces endophyticus]MEB8343224.1 SDR family oxidoreductase [Streptomyces endophyticus]